MTNPPEPTQQKWVDTSMEQGFALPKADIREMFWTLAIMVVIALLLIFFYPSPMPEKDRTYFFIFAGCGTLIFFAVFRYVSRYKLVYLSSAGIRGRRAFLWGWQRITWAEPLTNKSFTIRGDKFYTFTSSITGKYIDLPAVILQSPEFLSAVAIYAPPNHPFRDFKPEEKWGWW